MGDVMKRLSWGGVVLYYCKTTELTFKDTKDEMLGLENDIY